MDNQQLRIQQLENQNAQWQAWYQGQQLKPDTLPNGRNFQYAVADGITKKPKKAAKAAKAPSKKGLSTETKFFILCFILSIFAFGYLVEQWNKTEKPRTTKITAR